MDDTTAQAEETARHNAKMKKIKAARDKMMETKTEEKGLIVVHTGKGKGKSSSAFGMVMRCIAWGMPCTVVQFQAFGFHQLHAVRQGTCHAVGQHLAGAALFARLVYSAAAFNADQ